MQRSEGNEAELFLAVSGTPLFPKGVERDEGESELEGDQRRAG